MSWFIASMFGCASTTEAPQPKTSAQMWEDTLRQADVLTATQKDFAKTHELKGVTAQAAMDRLGAEGFSCSLEYKMLPTLEKGNTDHFVSEHVPMVYCSKQHARQSADDMCSVFWAAFEINWRDSSRQPEILQKELGISTIKNEMYFCRVSSDRQ